MEQNLKEVIGIDPSLPSAILELKYIFFTTYV